MKSSNVLKKSTPFQNPMKLVSNVCSTRLANHLETKMYSPKTRERFSPKHEQPLCLRNLCLDATLQLLTNIKTSERDARGKKAIRKYIEACLPQTLQLEVLDRAIVNRFPAGKMLRLLEKFEPNRAAKVNVNLIGNFRYMFGCYFFRNNLMWSIVTIDELNLSFAECERLYNFLLWGSLGELKSVALSTQSLALKHSRLPSGLARARALTSVTILNGATDHILRILGLNCPFLQQIDVSHSHGVTDKGMRDLLLRHPRNKNSIEMNECANSLNRLVLLGTYVTHAGYEFVCRNLEFGYSISLLPDTMIFRQKKDNLKIQSFEIDSATQPISKLGFSDATTRGMEQIVRRFVYRIPTAEIENAPLVMDLYEDKQFPSRLDIFLHFPTSFIVQCFFRIESRNIVKLILPWGSFDWLISSLPELVDLGTELPNLKMLKSRVQGTWQRSDILFPKLEDCQIWTIDDSTILSFLEHSPVLRTFMANSLDFNVEDLPNLKISDASVKNALVANDSLRNSLNELCIRPAPNLTSNTLTYLTTNCPNLTRLGDVESWNVSSNQMAVFNKRLDETNSRCVLTVLSFPPKGLPDCMM